MSARPPAIQLQEIDPVAYDGRYQIVSNGERFSLACWNGMAFVYSSGVPIEFTPTHYYRGSGGNA